MACSRRAVGARPRAPVGGEPVHLVLGLEPEAGEGMGAGEQPRTEELADGTVGIWTCKGASAWNPTGRCHRPGVHFVEVAAAAQVTVPAAVLFNSKSAKSEYLWKYAPAKPAILKEMLAGGGFRFSTNAERVREDF